MGIGHYDKDGKAISMEQWAALIGDHDYSRVALTSGCGRQVSTVWLGLDHSFGSGGPPIIFESMVFAVNGEDISGDEIDQVRYATLEEALEGHERLCSDHAYVLDRIVKKLEDEDAAMDDSGRSGASEAPG